MKWINHYQLFLFDLDGLLVNTEELHFKAYQNMCTLHGHKLTWSFERYCLAAMISSEKLKEEILKEFPSLASEKWERLYQQKSESYLQILEEGALEMMPGAEVLLQSLADANISRAVVTHSKKEQIEAICRKLPQLQTIPHWITREQYQEAKPSPDCYLKAQALLARPGDSVIGFEDSPRGLKALLDSGVKGVLVNTIFTKEEVREIVKKDFTMVEALSNLLSSEKVL